LQGRKLWDDRESLFENRETLWKNWNPLEGFNGLEEVTRAAETAKAKVFGDGQSPFRPQAVP
jgi:hypothetical protein